MYLQQESENSVGYALWKTLCSSDYVRRLQIAAQFHEKKNEPSLGRVSKGTFLWFHADTVCILKRWSKVSSEQKVPLSCSSSSIIVAIANARFALPKVCKLRPAAVYPSVQLVL